MYTKKMRSKINTASEKPKPRFAGVFEQYYGALFNKPIFLLYFGMFFNCLGIFLNYLNLPVYVVSKGFSYIYASYIVSLTGIIAVVGRLLSGFFSNLQPYKDIWLYSGSCAAVAIATIMHPYKSSTIGGNIGYAVARLDCFPAVVMCLRRL
jgi:MFS family permease